ncbi:MAG: hypothetical protein Q4D17_04215 [Planctomycetia bacterium]|nr:hypothetical protein [Planctomycetia bacterium]
MTVLGPLFTKQQMKQAGIEMSARPKSPTDKRLKTGIKNFFPFFPIILDQKKKSRVPEIRKLKILTETKYEKPSLMPDGEMKKRRFFGT